MIPAILPPRTGHIDGCFSLTFKRNDALLSLTAAACSLAFDFLIKTTGKSNFRDELARQLVLVEGIPSALASRTLMLNCLTVHYADLWNVCWNYAFVNDGWAKTDLRLDDGRFSRLTPEWQRHCALRTDYERRQALIEIDVLVAMTLRLTIDELCTIYRIQFPVLRQNEQDTWYDANGRIVFTCSKGLPGVGFTRAEFERIKTMEVGAVQRTVMDDTLPGGPRERVITYVAPFDTCDREQDFRTVWAEFTRRGSDMAEHA